MEWEVQYYPANFPICQSKEDLKKYIELQKSVHNGEFEKEEGIFPEREFEAKISVIFPPMIHSWINYKKPFKILFKI